MRSATDDRPAARSSGVSRRDALALLGTMTGLGLAGGWRQAATAIGQPPAFPPGTVIRTMLKDIGPHELGSGYTLMHEHLWRMATVNFDVLVDELRATYRDGVRCIVDAAALGRRSEKDMAILRDLATRVDGLHIVTAGGYWKVPYPPGVLERSDEALVDHLVEDARTQRWGAFGEIGSSLEMQVDERRVIRAVGRAHRRTGLPIFTHTDHSGCPTCAVEQLDLLESEGVPPGSVCIGHLGEIRNDPKAEVHRAIAGRGAFVGFDTLGHPGPEVTEGENVTMIKALVEAGFEDRVLMSGDVAPAGGEAAKYLKRNWGNGYSGVILQFVPKLRHAGIPEATIRKLLVDNPRRFLAFVPRAF